MSTVDTTNTIDNIINNIWIQRLFWSCIVILVAILVYFIISRIISAKEKRRSKIFNNKKNKTYLKMLRSVSGYIIVIMTILAILQIFGINTSSMLAGVGLIGLVVGFAVQDALKDIIKGFDILSDDYYNVGDYIKYKEIEFGKVLSVGLKTTKVEDIYTGNIVSIANRNIEEVAVVSGDIYLTIPLPYELSVERAESILKEATKKISKLDNVTSVELYGLTSLGDSAKNYLVGLTCDPSFKLGTRRAALHTIVTTLESHKISIPYPQLDIHTKK